MHSAEIVLLWRNYLWTVWAFQGFVHADDGGYTDCEGGCKETALDRRHGWPTGTVVASALDQHAVGLSLLDNLGFLAGGNLERLDTTGYEHGAVFERHLPGRGRR